VSFNVHLSTKIHGYWENGPPGCLDRLVLFLLGVINTDKATTAVSNVRLSILESGGLCSRGDDGSSACTRVEGISLQGSWGDASQPMPLDDSAAWAVSHDGQTGMGNGDILYLRFDQAVIPVPVADKAQVDKLLRFDPSDWAGDYWGQWVTDSMLQVTVLSVGNATSLVGTLRVSVRPEAHLASQDNSSLPCNASMVVRGGSWGDVVTVGGVYVLSATSLLVAIAWPVGLLYTPSSLVLELSPSREAEPSHATVRREVLVDSALSRMTLQVPPEVPASSLLFVVPGLGLGTGCYVRVILPGPNLPADMADVVPMPTPTLGPWLTGFALDSGAPQDPKPVTPQPPVICTCAKSCALAPEALCGTYIP
jgi:hypothetical protein